MPFTIHTIIPEGKQVRCIRCNQTWTSKHIRSECPGVPVYPFEQVPSYLKTLTALGRDRKHPPDPNQWDGAYRILKAPYYRLIYDERKAIHQPLTEQQQASIEKRRRTMREKYGCQLCDTYYRKDDQQWFKHGICQHCQNAAGSWNELIAWARHLVQEEALILDIITEPVHRPVSFLGRAPHCYYDATTNRHLIEWHRPETFLVTGYQTLSLTTGEIEHKVEQIRKEDDLFYLGHLMSPQPSPLVPPPFVLMASKVVADITYRSAFSGQQDRERSQNLETVPYAWHYYARTGRSWERVFEHDSGFTEREYIEDACTKFGMPYEQTASIGALIRLLVLHLAHLEMIEVIGDRKEEVAP
jgi:hypothetical protein